MSLVRTFIRWAAAISRASAHERLPRSASASNIRMSPSPNPSSRARRTNRSRSTCSGRYSQCPPGVRGGSCLRRTLFRPLYAASSGPTFSHGMGHYGFGRLYRPISRFSDVRSRGRACRGFVGAGAHRLLSRCRLGPFRPRSGTDADRRVGGAARIVCHIFMGTLPIRIQTYPNASPPIYWEHRS